MTGRVLTFADPEILRIAREDFIPVACDDWYQRRREDAEGDFFRAVADQGPRRHDGVGGPTRQGLYLLTADGELLGYRNHSDPEVMRRVIQDALAKWKARGEGPQLDIPRSFAPDQRYHREPPQGALVLRTFTRELTWSPEEGYGRHGERSPARDHLWILEEEWKAIVPRPGRIDLAFWQLEPLVQRIMRFHLVDATRGEPPFWKADEVMIRDTECRLREVRGEQCELLVTCTFSLGGEARGFEGVLEGTVTVNRDEGAILAIDWVAHGLHWGEGRWNRGAREGRTPLAVVFRYPADGPQVPPQAARDLNGYLAPR